MSHTLTHTTKKLARRLPPLPSWRTVKTLWAMLSKEQKMAVAARMIVLERPAADDLEARRDYVTTVAEMAYELLRVRERSEGGLEFA